MSLRDLKSCGSAAPDTCPEGAPEPRPEPRLEPGPDAGPRWLDRQLAGRLAGIAGTGEPRHSTMPEAQGPALRAALRLWQWERLCLTARAAASGSLHYGRLLGNGRAESLIRETAGFPGDRTARLLSLLPFTEADDLSAAPESFLAVPHDAVEGIISLPTSGTTGPGKRVYCTPADLALTADFFRHGMQYLVRPDGGRTGEGGPGAFFAPGSERTGGRPDSVVLLMSGDRPGSVGDLLLRGMRALGVPCAVAGFVPPGQAGEDAMMERLSRLAPTCLVGVPAQLFCLSRHADARALGLRSVLLSGDAVSRSLRRGIEAGFGCPVFVHYGLTECGLGGAVECGMRDGCHMREADLLHEIVDGKDRPLPPGEWGEIVITTLTREAMPLLRYRTGDEGRVKAGACACGSVLGRLEIRGRYARRVIPAAGTAVRGIELDEALFALAGLRSYAATVHRDAGGCAVGLVVGIAPVPGAGLEALLAQARAALDGIPGLAGLPVRVVPADATSPDDPRQGQAKMRFTVSFEPFPFASVSV